MNVDELNTLDQKSLYALLEMCCAAPQWIELMMSFRPYSSETSIISRAEQCWQQCDESDYLQAFQAHPKIGDLKSLKQKFTNTASLAHQEQGAVSLADDDVMVELTELNTQYEERFGFIFIVFATGKSAIEMLNLLKARVHHSRSDEIRIAAGEQLKITQLRLKKLLLNE